MAKSCIACFTSSYILAIAKVILNISLTRRKANITAERQYHSSLDEYHKSVRIYLVVAIPYGKSDFNACFFILVINLLKQDTQHSTLTFVNDSRNSSAKFFTCVLWHIANFCIKVLFYQTRQRLAEHIGIPYASLIIFEFLH